MREIPTLNDTNALLPRVSILHDLREISGLLLGVLPQYVQHGTTLPVTDGETSA